MGGHIADGHQTKFAGRGRFRMHQHRARVETNEKLTIGAIVRPRAAHFFTPFPRKIESAATKFVSAFFVCYFLLFIRHSNVLRLINVYIGRFQLSEGF